MVFTKKIERICKTTKVSTMKCDRISWAIKQNLLSAKSYPYGEGGMTIPADLEKGRSHSKQNTTSVSRMLNVNTFINNKIQSSKWIHSSGGWLTLRFYVILFSPNCNKIRVVLFI